MPRQARKTSGTGIYHVMLRGINRQDIFEDDEDRYKFLQCLSNLIEPYDERGYRIPALCGIFAYCLMPNHVHLLLQEKQEKLGEVVKRITIVYAYYFNRKYQRNRHLFQMITRTDPLIFGGSPNHLSPQTDKKGERMKNYKKSLVIVH